MEPYSLVRETGEGSWLDADPMLRPPKPTPHGPPTGSGGREKWFVDRRKSGKPNGYSLLSPKGHLPTPPSPPGRWAGRYGPPNVRATGQVTSEKYNFPTTPTRRESRGRTSFLWGFFFISSQKWGPRPGRPRSPPFQRCGAKPTRPPHPPHSRLSNPKLRMRFKLSRQFSFTFTQVSR